MAPEMVSDYRGATPAADQYAAAATLYNLIANEYVYDQPKRITAQLAQILDEDIVPLRDRRGQLPPKLISIIHRALSREPERRFPDVAAFKTALLPFGRV
jgi:serine/threonine-protein kinase